MDIGASSCVFAIAGRSAYDEGTTSCPGMGYTSKVVGGCARAEKTRKPNRLSKGKPLVRRSESSTRCRAREVKDSPTTRGPRLSGLFVFLGSETLTLCVAIVFVWTVREAFNPIQCPPPVKYRGGTMGNLSSALQQLRMERKQAQTRVESIDQAISVIESLNGSGTLGNASHPTRTISAASRRKMAQAQRARWARGKNGSQPVVAITKTTASAPVKRTMSASARRKIAAAQRARWAKVKAGKKAA